MIRVSGLNDNMTKDC